MTAPCEHWRSRLAAALTMRARLFINAAVIDSGWLPDGLAAALDVPVPNVERIRELLIDAYNASTGETLDGHSVVADQEAAKRVGAWLREGQRDLAFIRRQSHPSSAVYSDLASKLVRLGQTYCSTCGRYESEDPVVVIPVRISPVSVQVLRQQPGMVTAYKAALSQAFANRGHHFGTTSVCAQLTFLVTTGRRGDLDNLAKATLDAMQGHFFANDDQIAHLSLQRLTADGGEEAIVIRIQPSRLDEHHEVIDRALRIGWAGAEVIDLESFLP
jgi:Holliday junction resolvase RusA-like endonuclease